MAAMLRTIASRFSRRALAVDVAFCGILGGVGDMICQLGAEGRRFPVPEEWRWRRRGEPAHDDEVFDPRRLAASTVFSALYMGCCQHFIFQAYPFAVSAVARRLPLGAPRTQLLRDTPAHAHGCAWVDNVHCASSRRREFCHFADTPLHIPIEKPAEDRGGCSKMTASPTAQAPCCTSLPTSLGSAPRCTVIVLACAFEQEDIHETALPDSTRNSG